MTWHRGRKFKELLNRGYMVYGEETVGRLHNLFHVLFPDVPKPQAEGPFSGLPGPAQTSANMDQDGGLGLEGLECDKGEPKGGRPIAWPEGLQRARFQQVHLRVIESRRSKSGVRSWAGQPAQMWERDIIEPHRHVRPRSEVPCHWRPRGREPAAYFQRSSHRPGGIFTVHRDWKWRSKSTWVSNTSWKYVSHSRQKAANLGPKSRGGTESLTTRYVRWERGWWLRTGAESTQPGSSRGCVTEK